MAWRWFRSAFFETAIAQNSSTPGHITTKMLITHHIMSTPLTLLARWRRAAH
jgi:hypothetical protein